MILNNNIIHFKPKLQSLFSHINKPILILIVNLAIINMHTVADSLIEEAKQHFFTNNPSQAAVQFQQAIQEGNTDPETFIYLAFSYEQIGTYSRAIETLRQGLAYAQDTQHIFHYNLANLYLHQNNQQGAIDEYGRALSYRVNYPNAYLNRANIYLRQEEYNKALSDYQSFVNFAPDHDLTPSVHRLIAALSTDIEAEEQRIREEEERRQALLLEILGNLEQAGKEDPSLGAGTENISNEEEEFLRAE